MSLRERIEGATLRRAMDLPASVQRALTGSPVRRDGNTLAPELQTMLRLQKLVREPNIEDLPLDQAREALLRQARYVGGQVPVAATRDLFVDGAEGQLPARLYLPSTALAASPASPLLVFFHGGGMMYGGLESHDAPCRFLAENARVRVLAVDYRLAPEHRFPAAVEDCAAAYRWVVEHLERLGADRDRLAVGGDSAGGYLAATTAVVAAQEGLPLTFQLLIYPITDFTQESRSRTVFAEGFFLSKKFMDGAQAAFFRPGDDLADPRASVLMNRALPEDLAPAYVATAGFDPLRDEGQAYAALLAAHGVEVEAKCFGSLIHGFLNVTGCGHQALAANAEIAAVLRDALR